MVASTITNSGTSGVERALYKIQSTTVSVDDYEYITTTDRYRHDYVYITTTNQVGG